MRQSARSILGLSITLLLASAEALADVPIVYARCKRTDANLTVTGEVVLGGVRQTKSRTMRGLDVYDVLPDVVHFFSGFSAPCDLMHRDANGQERVLYDCSSKSTPKAACAALDPSVSFDGKRVAFAVFRGPLQKSSDDIYAPVIDPKASNAAEYFRHALPNQVLASTESRLHIVDIASGQITPLPHTTGTFDSGPAWLPNGQLTFTSSRDNHRATLVKGTNATHVTAQLFTSDPDGRNVDIVSHHALGRDEHPFVLRDGRVALSSWQIFGGRPFRYNNGSPGGPDTISNLFHIYTQSPDGANAFAFYGQHSGDHWATTAIGAPHAAAHFLTQSTDGRVWFADYYMGNNNGLGLIVGVMPEPEGQEGIGPDQITQQGDLYAPRNIVNLAPWASNADSPAKPMLGPPVKPSDYADALPWLGKLGHPSALPNNGLMVVWGKGPCSVSGDPDVFASLGLPRPPMTSGTGGGTALNVITSTGKDTPGCDAGIYLVKKIPVATPSQLVKLVDSRQWHEIQPRAAVPYSAIYGVAQPTVIDRADKLAKRDELPVGTPFGLLGAASILDRETHPYGGIHFSGEAQFNRQGTDTIKCSDDKLCGVRILGVLPNRGPDTYHKVRGLSGERVVILGEFGVRNVNGGKPRMDPSGNPDTSFLVRFPANTPYLMQGIDCEGHTLNTDQTWQSLRPGEMKTCGGCHVHAKPSRVNFGDTYAATAEYPVVRLGEGNVPILAGKAGNILTTRSVPGYAMAIEFERDIFPIFQRRCNSCHGGGSPAGGLALDRPGVAEKSTWWCLVDDISQSCVPAGNKFTTDLGGVTFRRPQRTKYIRAFNSLGSLLYWKAKGARTDGNSDSTFTGASPPLDRDIDFGPAHPTRITADELGLLLRWIDIGGPAGAGELEDTQKPTLNLSATIANGAVTELLVGSVDVPSGIDTTSLEVCIMSGDRCGPNLAPAASPHDVVKIALGSPLTDNQVEVRAKVRDIAGNETVVKRTVRYLLSAPPPTVTASEGGSVDGNKQAIGSYGCCAGILGPAAISSEVFVAIGAALCVAFRRGRRLARRRTATTALDARARSTQ